MVFRSRGILLFHILISINIKGCYDTQHNDIQHNDIQHNDIQHNDIQHNDIQHNNIQHDDTHHIDTQHNAFTTTINRMQHSA
jgi:hypothetical protein